MEEIFKSISALWMPAIVIILMLAPFWYISLYLFHRKFFDSSNQTLRWAFSFCFSFCWIIIFSLGTLIDLEYRPIEPSPDEVVVPLIESEVGNFYFRAGGTAVMWLGLTIVIGYFILKNKPGNFVRLFLISTIFSFVSIILRLVCYRLFYN